MRTVAVETAPTLTDIWSALHTDVELKVRASEVHFLRMLALGADDDVVSQLLLRKLRLAHVAADVAEPDRVFLNSFVEYRFDAGPATFGQLVRPSPHAPSYAIGVTSLLGAGLIGLRAGQIVLWPNAGGTLCDLHLLHVENRPGLGQWLGGEAAEGPLDA
jgi:hypothetical protein